MIEKWKIQQLSATPIELVAERLGLQIIKHKSRCPFHEDRHPSLSFDTRRNRYRCYVCDARGGVIDLVMNLRRCGFVEACNYLSPSSLHSTPLHSTPASGALPAHCAHNRSHSEPKPDIEYLQSLLARPSLNNDAQEWLANRRIDERVVRWCRLSSIDIATPCWRYGKPFYDAPSLLIPYYGVDGRLMSVQSRYLGKEDKSRFRFPRGASCHIYNLQVLRLLEASEELWITEGCSDCWAMLSSGRKAIAIPSATMIKEEDLEPLKGLNLHMYPDQDEPGERLFCELHKRLPQLVRHQLPSTCKDFGDLWSTSQLSTSLNTKHSTIN